MAIGDKLFKAKNNKEVFKLILDLDFKLPQHIDPDVKDLIEKLVVKNPIERLGFKNFNKLKQHKFFNGMNWNALQEKQLISPLDDFHAIPPDSNFLEPITEENLNTERETT